MRTRKALLFCKRSSFKAKNVKIIIYNKPELCMNLY